MQSVWLSMPAPRLELNEIRFLFGALIWIPLIELPKGRCPPDPQTPRIPVGCAPQTPASWAAAPHRTPCTLGTMPPKSCTCRLRPQVPAMPSLLLQNVSSFEYSLRGAASQGVDGPRAQHARFGVSERLHTPEFIEVAVEWELHSCVPYYNDIVELCGGPCRVRGRHAEGAHIAQWQAEIMAKRVGQLWAAVEADA